MMLRWNKLFDSLARTEIQFASRRVPAFQVCGGIGLLLALVTGAGLARFAALSLPMVAVLGLSGCATFLVLAMGEKVLTGRERLVYYHHQTAVLIVSAAVLWAMGRPVLLYLDVVALGVGVFLACGRAGCLMVGCCHGLPCRFGVRYGSRHTRAGFTAALEGVRLFPVQAVEAACVIAAVLFGAAQFLNESASGSALVSYLLLYSIVRFHLEFHRGDPGRWRGFGLNEGQWTALAHCGGLTYAGAAGWLPLEDWHFAIACAPLLGVVWCIARGARRPAVNRIAASRPLERGVS